MRVLSIPYLFWILHLALLKQYAGIGILMIGFTRDFGAGFFKEKNIRYLIFVCVVLGITVTFILYNTLIDILPFAGFLCFCGAAWLRHYPVGFRASNILGEGCWLLYAMAVSSITLSLASGFMLISLVISMWRHDFKDRSWREALLYKSKPDI